MPTNREVWCGTIAVFIAVYSVFFACKIIAETSAHVMLRSVNSTIEYEARVPKGRAFVIQCKNINKESDGKTSNPKEGFGNYSNGIAIYTGKVSLHGGDYQCDGVIYDPDNPGVNEIRSTLYIF